MLLKVDVQLKVFDRTFSAHAFNYSLLTFLFLPFVRENLLSIDPLQRKGVYLFLHFEQIDPENTAGERLGKPVGSLGVRPFLVIT